MRKLVLKLLRSPRTLWRLFADRWLVPAWLRVLGVQVGRGCRFAGWPIVQLGPGAHITLEDGVLIISRPDGNPAGISHPTILAAVGVGSAIVVGAGAGISGASIVAQRAVTIGNRVLIGAGACVWDTDFHPLEAEQRRIHPTRGAMTAPVRIGEDVFIGARAMVLKGASIGAGTVVGAGAVVVGDLPAGTMAGGNPARVIPVRQENKTLAQTERIS